MRILKRIFDLYLQGSLHVALSVYCLIRITEIMLVLPANPYVAGFGFFGTIVGYNFIKYDALARSGKPKLSLNLKLFIAISVLAFIGTGYCFLKLSLLTKVVSAVVLVITALYTLPFFPNHKNARSWAGFKIYMVALCWVGVTVVLPVLNANAPMATDFYIICIKRFILIVVLLFVFEIIDLAWDDPHLKTVPQQIGIRRTKKLGVLLLLVFLFLELFQMERNWRYFAASIFLILMTQAFLLFATQIRSRYYTSFWTESIPMFWFLAILLLDRV
jgi:hypothetical protein